MSTRPVVRSSMVKRCVMVALGIRIDCSGRHASAAIRNVWTYRIVETILAAIFTRAGDMLRYVTSAIRGGASGSTLWGIQYARAAAAIAVVAYHACNRVSIDFERGSFGVDVFFVISGFIMWKIAGTKDVSPGGFMFDRIKRIVPLYWIATFVLIFAGFSGIVPRDQNDLSSVSIFNSLFFIPYIADGATKIWPILTPGWTLNYEMFFYAVFAVCLFLPFTKRLYGLTAIFVVLPILGFITHPEAPPLITYTSPLLWLFIGGVWIAELDRKDTRLPALGSLIAIVAGVFMLCVAPVHDGSFASWVSWPAAVMIVAGVTSLDATGRTAKLNILRYLGDASYSINLWHGIALTVVTKISHVLNLPTALAVVVGIIGGTVGGVVAYELVEKPIANALKRRRRSKPALA